MISHEQADCSLDHGANPSEHGSSCRCSYTCTRYGFVDSNDAASVASCDEGICAGCGVATISINYCDLGCATGEMAYEILVSGADVSAMPVEFAPVYPKVHNAELCELLGITIPEGYEPVG